MRSATSTLAAILLLAGALSLHPIQARAQAPTTQSAAAPTSEPTTDIQKHFDQLADADPNVRDEARVALMGLQREQLADLRNVVEKNRPLAPSQLAVLHDIVIQVFLATEPYDKDNAGFLGVHPLEVHQAPVGSPDDNGLLAQGVDGVRVSNFVPGFCGYRFLHENDIVLGLVGKDYVSTRRAEDFTELVRATPPGETISLQILRQGRVIRVTIKVDARPQALQPPQDITEFNNARLEAAEKYWQTTFGPLVVGTYS